MIKNYLKSAVRSLLKSKFYSALNLIGLTVGLTAGLMILLLVDTELNWDHFNKKIDRIYRVNAEVGKGQSRQTWAMSPGSVAYSAKKSVPGVLNAARIMPVYDYSIFSYKRTLLDESDWKLFSVDPSLFQIFDLKWLKGNRNQPFDNIQSVVITSGTAKRFFGSADPIGKVILADGKTPYTVSGLIEDFPSNSSIGGDIFFPIEINNKYYTNPKSSWKSIDGDWSNYTGFTFLQLAPGISPDLISKELTSVRLARDPYAKGNAGNFILQPLKDIHLYNPDGTSSLLQTIEIYSLASLLILIIVCINYVNLSTARSISRSKEVSVRKIIGARRTHLLIQFITETVVLFLFALSLSIGLIKISMPLFNTMVDSEIEFNLFDLAIWKVIGSAVLITVFASSIYPALLLSSFKPIEALKGKISTGLGSAGFRRVLVVSQFTFSIALIIGTIVMSRQMNYLKTQALGYDRSHVFSINLHAMKDHLQAVKTELSKEKGISNVATGEGSTVNNNNSSDGIDWNGKDPKVDFFVNYFAVDKDFINIFKIKLTAGTGFSGAKTDSTHFILNETAIRLAGIKNPVGSRLKYQNTEGTIIGVVKDFHFQSLKSEIKPMIFYYKPQNYQLFVRTSGDPHAAIHAVKKLWDQYNPNFPFSYSFLEDEYNNLYKSEEHTSLLISIFACIAVLISCLGLFGLATYTAQIRIKEIGIRKVLGANSASIVSLLASNFLNLILISVCIASPLAYFAMRKWLQNFAYRTTFDWSIFAISGFAALGIAFLTIGFQSLKASLANPIQSLKNE